MYDRERWPRGWRAIVLMGIGVFMGATLITPAVAHVGGTVTHLWTNHIRPRVISLGDSRWVNTGEAAGGDLSGTHANLQINADAVGSAEIAAAAVGASEIADGSVGAAEIGADAVGSSELGAITVRTNASAAFGSGQTGGNGDYITRAVTVRCNAGETVLSGGASWDSDVNDEEVFISRSHFVPATGFPFFLPPGWRVRGGVDVNADYVLTAEVLCLA